MTVDWLTGWIYSILPSRISRLAAKRWVRRIEASRILRISLGASGRSAGISLGRPSRSTATKTRYAEATCTGSIPARFQGSLITLTPTSIEVRPAQLTCALARRMSPT